MNWQCAGNMHIKLCTDTILVQRCKPNYGMGNMLLRLCYTFVAIPALCLAHSIPTFPLRKNVYSCDLFTFKEAHDCKLLMNRANKQQV